MARRTAAYIGFALVCGLLVTISIFKQAKPKGAGEPESAYGTYVDAKGNITLPPNFLIDWPALGTWSVLKDGTVDDIHNVYAPGSVIEYYQKNKEFPDGAIIVKEVRHARGAPHTTGNAFWVDDVKVWFVMVRDRKGRFPNNPLWGEGWGWALFNGGDRTKQVSTDYKQDCLHCHVPVKNTEWIYVYAYPVLGNDVLKYAPSRKPAVEKKAEAKPVSDTASKSMSSADPAVLEKGKAAFNVCQGCHSLEPGNNGTGPSLAGVIGRKAGTANGYSYSDAMKASEHVWNAETLDKYLLDVPGFIPGNRMARLFRGGVKDADERRAIIAYLLSMNQ